jgi:hypothetical protein
MPTALATTGAVGAITLAARPTEFSGIVSVPLLPGLCFSDGQEHEREVVSIDPESVKWRGNVTREQGYI